MLGRSDDDPVGVALRAAARRARACRRAMPRICSPRSGMDVTKLRYRDWDDLIGYCTLFGHAGRTLRARRPRREPRDLARQRRALRGAADHQSPAGLRQGLPRSRSRLYSARCARRSRRHASRRSAPSARRRRCCACIRTARAPHRRSAAPAAGRSPPASRTRGSRLEVAVIQTLGASVWSDCCGRAIR